MVDVKEKKRKETKNLENLTSNSSEYVLAYPQSMRNIADKYLHRKVTYNDGPRELK